MYNITDYSYAKANQIGVIIKPSEKAGKKLDVYDPNGNFICSVGAYGMGDFPSYIESHGLEFANERRKRFYQRFKNIQKDTKLWYSAVLLW
ncbi:MAG: hypothetical protein RLZZ293_1240 [Pseudomonadota bacterium]|jgi:hypothetical protein